jgi:hypothetical protein
MELEFGFEEPIQSNIAFEGPDDEDLESLDSLSFTDKPDEDEMEK